MLSPFRKHLHPFDRAHFLQLLEDIPFFAFFRVLAIVLFFALLFWFCVYATAPSD